MMTENYLETLEYLRTKRRERMEREAKLIESAQTTQKEFEDEIANQKVRYEMKFGRPQDGATAFEDLSLTEAILIDSSDDE